MGTKPAAVVAAFALSVTALTQLAAAGAPDRPSNRGGAVLARLFTESGGRLHVARGPDGLARFIGVSGESRDPAVVPATSPRRAARLHLDRYGAALGLSGPGTTLVPGRTVRSVTGDDVVRFAERRDGLPVVGGSVAVDLRPDRQLGSVAASVSRASVPRATYAARAAAREAIALALRHPGHPPRTALHADRPSRRLYDPAVLGVARTGDPRTHARGVWWVVVRGGPAYRRLVLVDDRSGAVVQDVDLVENIDRVVCDGQDFYAVDIPCTSDFARVEGGPASPVRDVNQAFDLAGPVSRFYRQIGGLHLTRLLGVEVSGARKLAATVRFCEPGAECPLQNAFWNGVQMFYGDGFAGADDVVGHEMTHGVIQHNSALLYWGQSGAINESLADVMGEIIDHRHPSPGDTPNSWTIGEDLPIGAIRSLSQPSLFGQPAAMTSRRYVGGIDDNGGVHTDSGVGNKTFYLISQGGTFGGQTVTGIDDATLTKSATLYLSVIQHLVSGSDYADLAAVLEQSCADLAAAGTVGFTTADCTAVHQATLATRLRTTPRGAPQPPDAPMTCPPGAGPVRVLFDSETGAPRAKFLAGPTWSRAPDAAGPANATSGRASWFSLDPEDPGVSPLIARVPVALPAGRPAYLWFQQWRVLDFIGHGVFDAGTVGVADSTLRSGPQNAAGLPWVNGPVNRIDDRYGNPGGGQLGFGRDSRGYLASRADLSRYAGHAVTPRFTMYTDNSVAYPGWYLDDIRVYTCGGVLVPTAVPLVTGETRVGERLTATPGAWSLPGVTTTYRWFADGHRIAGATGRHYRIRPRDLRARLSVRVTAFKTGHGHASTSSAGTGIVRRP